MVIRRKGGEEMKVSMCKSHLQPSLPIAGVLVVGTASEFIEHEVMGLMRHFRLSDIGFVHDSSTPQLTYLVV